jgi:hypothetical protein
VLENKIAERILKASEGVLQQVADFLGDLARRSSEGLKVLLLFAEEDDYFQYLSFFYEEGTHPASSGVHLHRDYPHIALRYYSEPRSVDIIAHELAHNCLGHLRIPRWLNEGVAISIEKVLTNAPGQLLPDDIVERHHRFWNEERLQGFWAPADRKSLRFSRFFGIRRLGGWRSKRGLE